MFYILHHYPRKTDFSNARVTKMVYLCDWKCAIENGCQMTSIKWYFDNYGPFVWDVLDTAREKSDVFFINKTQNDYGNAKAEIGLKSDDFAPNLSEEEKKVADHVIEQTKNLSWRDFINLVYSTYPVVSTEKYEFLNLTELAIEYKQSSLYKAK